MVRPDYSHAEEDRLPPDGAYRCEVLRAEEKRSKNNDAMFFVSWRGVDDRTLRVFDYIMLQGRGAGIGGKKLEALGWPRKFDGNIEAHELIGKRAVLHLVAEEYNGRTSLKVDTSGGDFCGYDKEEGGDSDLPFTTPPEASGEPISVDDTPF